MPDNDASSRRCPSAVSQAAMLRRIDPVRHAAALARARPGRDATSSVRHAASKATPLVGNCSSSVEIIGKPVGLVSVMPGVLNMNVAVGKNVSLASAGLFESWPIYVMTLAPPRITVVTTKATANAEKLR